MFISGQFSRMKSIFFSGKKFTTGNDHSLGVYRGSENTNSEHVNVILFSSRESILEASDYRKSPGK